MRKKKKQKGPKSKFEQLKEEAPEFAEALLTRGTDDLKDLVINIELKDKEIEEFKKQDSDLASRKEQALEAARTYSVPLTLNKLKRRVIAEILEERGKA